eukprot:scaffold16708_cov118-Isochrysis_galbana.AAC.1
MEADGRAAAGSAPSPPERQHLPAHQKPGPPVVGLMAAVPLRAARAATERTDRAASHPTVGRAVQSAAQPPRAAELGRARAPVATAQVGAVRELEKAVQQVEPEAGQQVAAPLVGREETTYAAAQRTPRPQRRGARRAVGTSLARRERPRLPSALGLSGACGVEA